MRLLQECNVFTKCYLKPRSKSGGTNNSKDLQNLYKVYAKSLQDCCILLTGGLATNKGTTMKRLMSLLLAGTLLIGTAGFAQQKAMARQDTGINAIFYDGIPSESGEIVEDDFGQAVEVSLVSNSIGKRIHNLEDAKYIELQMGEEPLVFKIFGGDTTNEMTLEATTNDAFDGDGTTISLGEVTAALNNTNQDVAVFVDGDGVVQGFYTYTPDNFPTINVEDAETVLLMGQNGTTTFETDDPGTVSLGRVLVLQNGEYVPLNRTSTFAPAAL